MMRATIWHFTGQKRTRNEGVMDETVKKVQHLTKFLLSVVDKTTHLGANVFTRILSNRRQLGPQAETFKQEGYLNYDMQLLDRQEPLRSSRNLDQKMTSLHKEHSNGLRSQDHILRTQARLCARPKPCKSRQCKLSDGTKNVEIRHRELGQIRT